MKNDFAKIKHYLDIPKKKRTIKYIKNKFKHTFKEKEELLFKGWEIKYPEIKFIYQVKDKNYYCTLNLNNFNEAEFNSIEKNTLVFALSCIGLSFLPRHFSLGDFDIINSDISLPQSIIDFFEKSIVLSIAEHRYRDGRDPTKPVKIKCDTISEKHSLIPKNKFQEKILILNGGGKDTVVSVEISKTLCIDMALLSVNLTNGSSLKASQDNIASISGIKQHYNMDVFYGEELYRDAKYAMVGLPYLLSFDFLAVLPAIMHGYSYVVSGNEFSSNFGNTKFKGMNINHQYPKSYEYEQLTANLIKNNISKHLNNFSLLRPYHDIQLAKFFSKHNAYFSTIISCNIDPASWCKKCPKCAFTYIACLAFLDEKEMRSIFNDDFLKHPIIRREVVELTTSKLKPWECVGTQKECKLALKIILEKFPNMDFDSWPTRKDLINCCHEIDLNIEKDKYLNFYNENNLIPGDLKKIINEKYHPTA